jgi:DNA-binding response OmpR family regulator
VPDVLAGLELLVVDDDPFAQIIASLELPDLTLLEASGSAEAYQMAVARRPGAIVVDLRLSDGDGLDLVRRVRRTVALARTPVVVLTSGHDEAQRATVLQAGADGYLAKPFDAEVLVTELARVMAIPPEERRPRRTDEIRALRARR